MTFGIWSLCVVSPCRPAELPGRQPPGVARPGGADVLLVASNRRAHHALQAQPDLPAGDQQQLSSADSDVGIIIIMNY